MEIQSLRKSHNARKNYLLTILLPNGIKEISRSLKCCRPQGIPIMVMYKRAPMKRCTSAVYHPPKTIHIKLQKVERQPVFVLSLITFLPKGKSTRPAILKHCNPQGIPITVIQSTKPPMI